MLLFWAGFGIALAGGAALWIEALTTKNIPAVLLWLLGAVGLGGTMAGWIMVAVAANGGYVL